MKKVGIAIGALLTLGGIYQGAAYVADYNVLSRYGQGYVWGSGIMLLLGGGLLIISLRQRPGSRFPPD